MAVSVIVSNFNGAKYLPRLLETLRAQRNVTMEIIVVERQSKDDSAAILKQNPDVKVVVEPPESGLVCGYNAGVPLAQYEHLFFCNEDMWFDPDCLAELEKQIDLSKRIAISDPWQWTYDGATWIHGGVRFTKKKWEVNSAFPLRKQMPTVDLPLGSKIPFACAGAMLMHRDVYKELGGWDTKFFLDQEDVDLSVRAWQAGWDSVTVPQAKVYHAVNASNVHFIPNVKQLVKRRRYISGRSNVAVIALKTFSTSRLFWPVLGWAVNLMNNLCKLRFRMAWCDVLAAKETFSRYGEVRKYRAKTKQLRKSKPGEKFFTLPEYNA